MSAAPSRTVEVERTYDVDSATPLPDLAALPGVAAVGAAQRRELDARYLDTADLALAQAGYALRRRTGGPDAGWHLKGPVVDGARLELGWALGSADEDVPDAVRATVAERLSLDVVDLAPLARLRTVRTAYALTDAGGAVVAEFVDDLVASRDERSGRTDAWREWELELGPAAPADPRAFFTAAMTAVAAVGGRSAASASKLARALGR